MFQNFKLQRLQRSAVLAELEDGLIYNLTSDLYYSDFPHACRLRETLQDGDIHYRIVGNPAAARRILITVSEGDQTRGTLVHEMPDGELRLRLHPLNGPDRGEQWLLAKLMRLAEIDQARRRRDDLASTSQPPRDKAVLGASPTDQVQQPGKCAPAQESRILPMRVSRPETLSERPARRDDGDNVIRFPFPR